MHLYAAITLILSNLSLHPYHLYRAEFTNARNFLLLLLVEVTTQSSLFFEGFSGNYRTVLSRYSKTAAFNGLFHRKKQDERRILTFE